MKDQKYQFKCAINFHKKLLICPQCYEPLSHVDIENFTLCPYCDFSFEQSNELEDFILQPVIDSWVSQFSKFSSRNSLPFSESEIF